MRLGLGIAIIGITTLAMFSPVRAQIFHFGIGDEHHGHDEGERHGYDEGGHHQRHWHPGGGHWEGGGYCRHLRWKCVHKYELGQEGEGNCQRFREECQ